MKHKQPSLGKKCLAEFLGTYLLILFGCGAVHASVLTGAQSGLWQVAIVWGIAIMLAVYTVGAVSGAHINPAITLAFAVWGRFPWRSVLPYVLAQLIGAFLAAATLFVFFNPYLKTREQEKHVVRGSPGSELTAMCYGEYFPSPGPLSNAEGPYSVDAHERLNVLVSEPTAFCAELLGTLVLAMVVFAVTDERNSEAPPDGLAPVFIGLTVSGLISVIAPLTWRVSTQHGTLDRGSSRSSPAGDRSPCPGLGAPDSSPSTSSPRSWVRSSAPVFISTASELHTRPMMSRTPRSRDDPGILGGSGTSTSFLPGDWRFGCETKWCVS